MKRMVTSLLVAALLLGAIPALATSDTNGLPTGIIVGSRVPVLDIPMSGGNVVGTLDPGTGVIVMQQQGVWLQVFVRAQRLAGWVSVDAVQIDQGPPIYPGIVISQNVSLRESPSTGARRIMSIPNGAIFDLLDEQNGWYYVRYWDGKTAQPVEGYVRVDFVVRDPMFLTTSQSTYVYATPSRADKKVGQLSAGTQLTVIGEYNDFWVVNLRSASGFIYKNDISAPYLSEGGNG